MTEVVTLTRLQKDADKAAKRAALSACHQPCPYPGGTDESVVWVRHYCTRLLKHSNAVRRWGMRKAA